MALKPWLTRRIPAMAKSTAAKLRGDDASGVVVDGLPPMSVDDLLKVVHPPAPVEPPDLHPDLLPPLPDAEDAIPAPEARQELEPDFQPPDVSDGTLEDLGPMLDAGLEGCDEAYAPEPTEMPDFALDFPPPPPPETGLLLHNELHGELPPAPLMPPSIDRPLTGENKDSGKSTRSHVAPKLLDPEERGAYMRAVNLFHKLQRVGNEGRQGAIHRLFDIVVAFPHGASVVSIGNLLDAGCGLHEVEDAAALKEHWRSDSALWLRRYLGSMELHSDSRHQTHLSWVTAHMLSAAMGRDRALDAMQGILLQEWLTMDRSAYSGSTFEFCFYHHFLLKRAQEISAGSMDPILQIYENSTEDDPKLPLYIEVRNTSPNFTGRARERVFLPGIHNMDYMSSTFSQQTNKEKKAMHEAKGESDAG